MYVVVEVEVLVVVVEVEVLVAAGIIVVEVEVEVLVVEVEVLVAPSCVAEVVWLAAGWQRVQRILFFCSATLEALSA